MKINLAILAFLAFFASTLSILAIGSEPDETPGECKTRLGSARECLASTISFHQMNCELTAHIYRLDPSAANAKKISMCGSEAKKKVRPFYDAVLRDAKKSAAISAAKKTLQAFFAVMADPPGTAGLQNNLQTALAELEVELP